MACAYRARRVSAVPGPARARLLALIVVIALSACASVPLSTAVRLSRFDERAFAALDAEAVRVRVSVPQGYEPDAAATMLGVTIVSSGESRTSSFALEPLTSASGTRPAGMFSNDLPVVTEVFRLSETSRANFRELQQFVGSRRTEDLKVAVTVGLAKALPGSTEVTVWVDLLLSASEGYLPLIDRGTISLGHIDRHRW